MRRSGWGRIVCITSVSVKSPLPGMILSNTVRPGVVGYAKTVAEEFAQDGITVNVVCPGYMATDRVNQLAEHRAAEAGSTVDEIMAGLVANIPSGRMGDPKELGDLVAFLASDRAAYITGTTVQIDGGYIRGLL
jgi:3-oxoacyl-[acyl-carrier protein] reductase